MVLIRLCLILGALLMLSISAAHAQSNPGWPTGYVPSAAEWANQWSGKRDYNSSIPACTWVPCQPAVGIVPNGVLQSTGGGGLLFGSTLPSGITAPNANLTGTTTVNSLSLSTPLSSASGGSGVASPAPHSLLISEGSFPFDLIAPGMAGQIPISQGPTIDPAFKAISGDFTISSTGAGALTALGSGGGCTYCTITYDTKGRVTSSSTGSVPGSTPPGGSNGQLQYNNSSAFGGFTPSGACTVNVSTGVYTCFGTSNTTLAFSNITGQVTLAQLPNISAGILGNLSGNTTPSLITFTQTTAALNPCTSSLQGMVPSPPNNASAFLNGTCGWSVPSGAGNFSGPSSSTSGDLVSFNGASGTLGQDSGINQSTVITTTNSTTLNANRLTGTLQAGQFPALSGGVSNTAGSTNISLSNPSPTALGGANSFATQTNMFLTGLSTTGAFTSAQVGFANLAGSASSSQLASALLTPPPIGQTTPAAGSFSKLLSGSAAANPVPGIDGSIMTVTGVINSGTLTNNNGAGVFLKDDLASVGPGNSQNAVVYYGVGQADVNSAWIWGLNPVLYDTPGITGAALNNEFDFNVNNASTTVYGLLLQGASSVQPTGTHPAVEVAPLDVQNSPSHISWSYGLETLPGAAAVGVYIGALTAGTSSTGSQPIEFGYGASQILTMTVSQVGNLTILPGMGNVPGSATGIVSQNNGSNTSGTAADVIMTTIDGQGQFAEEEVGGGVARTAIFNTGSGGINFVTGAGGMFINNTAAVSCSAGTVNLTTLTIVDGLATHC